MEPYDPQQKISFQSREHRCRLTPQSKSNYRTAMGISSHVRSRSITRPIYRSPQDHHICIANHRRIGLKRNSHNRQLEKYQSHSILALAVIPVPDFTLHGLWNPVWYTVPIPSVAPLAQIKSQVRGYPHFI